MGFPLPKALAGCRDHRQKQRKLDQLVNKIPELPWPTGVETVSLVGLAKERMSVLTYLM